MQESPVIFKLKILFFFGEKLFPQLSVNYILLKNVKYKVMFTEVYFEPSRISMMELFRENSKRLVVTIFAKKLPRRCLTGF